MVKNDSKKYKIIAIFNIIAMALFVFVFIVGIRNTIYYRTHGGSPSMAFAIAAGALKLINKIGLSVFVCSLGKANKRFIAAGLMILLQAVIFFADLFITWGDGFKVLQLSSTALMVAGNYLFAAASQKAFDQIDSEIWDHWRKFKKSYLFVMIATACFGAVSYLPGIAIIGIPGFFIGCACVLILNVLMIIYMFKSAKSLNKLEA